MARVVSPTQNNVVLLKATTFKTIDLFSLTNTMLLSGQHTYTPPGEGKMGYDN